MTNQDNISQENNIYGNWQREREGGDKDKRMKANKGQ